MQITDKDYTSPSWPTSCSCTDLYMVECANTVPRTKELFHSFHAAYLYAYQVAEGTKLTVDIAHKEHYLMRVQPDREVYFYQSTN